MIKFSHTTSINVRFTMRRSFIFLYPRYTLITWLIITLNIVNFSCLSALSFMNQHILFLAFSSAPCTLGTSIKLSVWWMRCLIRVYMSCPLFFIAVMKNICMIKAPHSLFSFMRYISFRVSNFLWNLCIIYKRTTWVIHFTILRCLTFRRWRLASISFSLERTMSHLAT